MSVSFPQAGRSIEASDLILTPEEAKKQLQEYELAKRAANLLDKTYPNHLWTVEVKGGVMVVRNLALAGDWGFVLHPHKHLDLDHSVKYAGGELLERFNISRGANGADQSKEYLANRMKQAKQIIPSSAL